MFKFKKRYVLALVIFFVISPVLYAEVIKDDFRVNDDTTGGANDSPTVEITKNGESIVIWPDGRNGEPNIYGQAYDTAGNGVGASFKLSTLPAQNNESRPAISSYHDSLLVIFQYGYGQWLLSDGSQSGGSFYLQSGNIYYPDVAVGDSGFFLVCNNYMGGSGYEIMLKRFDFDGDSLGNRILVNDDGTTYNQLEPKIAMSGDGNFVVVWYDYRNGNDPDIYGQLFNSSGDKIGSNFLINDDAGSNYQYYPSCAIDWAGNFVVVWEDYRSGNSDIYGQRFAPDGDTTGLGGNFLINDDGGTEYQYRPSCSMDSAGNFVVVWYDGRSGNSYDIYGQLYNNTGAAQGANFRIDQCPGSESQFEPEVSMNDSNFVVTWLDDRNSTGIYKRSYYNNGIPVSDEVRVNDVDGTVQQYNPAIDMNVSGNAVIAWEDHRSLPGIYFQRLTAQGETVGANTWVYSGYYPDVSVHKDGSYVITYRYYDGNIYAKRYDAGGNPVGSPVQVNDTSNVNPYSGKVDMDTLGNFVVTWYDYRSGNVDIYGQRFDSSGDTIGENFKVNDDVGTYEQYYPSIAYSSSGRFLITWQDYRNVNYDIFGQIYGANGNPIGPNFRIDDDAGANNQYYPNAEPLADGNFIVVWQDERTPYGIYGQLIDTTGNPVGSNFKVNEGSVGTGSPSVAASPAGGFVVSWYDYRDGNYNIYAQNYKPDYSPDSINYKVNNEVEGLNPDQYYPNVATNGTNIIFTWQDPKWERGWDVAAKVFGEPSGIEDVIQEGKGIKILGISSPVLSGKEWLTISLGSPARVEFRIINVAGIVVSSQELTYDTPGIKKVGVDVSKLPCGLYFLSLETQGGKAVKKTVVIR